MANTPNSLPRAVSGRRITTPRWRSLLPLLAILTIALPMVSIAQTPNTINAIGAAVDGSCGTTNECCVHLQLTVNQTTDKAVVDFASAVSPIADCIDHACINPPVATVTKNSAGEFEFDFSPAAQPGMVYDIYICAPSNCWCNWSWWNVNTSNLGAPAGVGGGVIPNCGGCVGGNPVPTDCSGCDTLMVYKQDCWIDICVNHLGSGPNSFTLNFNPPLQPCNHPSPTDPHGPCEGWTNPTIIPQYPWTYTISPDGSTIIVSGGNYEPCQEVCIAIPTCMTSVPPSDTRQPVTITLTSPNACPGNGATVAMKQSDGSWIRPDGSSASPNYPNPVTASTGFKTLIPFTTAVQGTAYIRVVNAKGEEVLKDNEDVTYAGQHFFYFSADQLPSGTYFYQIEFPKGVIITSKTILVVK
ncbi:MAG: T9SS type A sorting domain-containing protein [Bacteroidota bacterium]|nr:T9SS type A sorting domain-containing protein [Bacteroidota bacterium]MDP4234500.1 T9SS type A sorting domain-containing protein [Bacteroidota bacterium]MDP4243850.1 T9SS type A sorting domain-containing protein [Bacteroidota bacterium]MDP4289198.1 T9SS type A sorting domain-containing protein [Bacteroidota bacterium]